MLGYLPFGMLFVLALHPRPRSMLEIGLATGSWSRVITAYEPVKKHQIVEIDPDYLPLIGLYTPQRDLLTDGKVAIHIDDGRRWLNRNDGEKFDFILQNRGSLAVARGWQRFIAGASAASSASLAPRKTTRRVFWILPATIFRAIASVSAIARTTPMSRGVPS